MNSQHFLKKFMRREWPGLVRNGICNPPGVRVHGVGRTKPKRSQFGAEWEQNWGGFQAGLLRKRPVFTGNCGVWPVLSCRTAGGEKLQNEATVNVTEGNLQASRQRSNPTESK